MNGQTDWTEAKFEVRVKVSLHPPGAERPDFITSEYSVIDPKTKKEVFVNEHTFDNVKYESFNRVSKNKMGNYRNI